MTPQFVSYSYSYTKNNAKQQAGKMKKVMILYGPLLAVSVIVLRQLWISPKYLVHPSYFYRSPQQQPQQQQQQQQQPQVTVVYKNHPVFAQRPTIFHCERGNNGTLSELFRPIQNGILEQQYDVVRSLKRIPNLSSLSSNPHDVFLGEMRDYCTPPARQWVYQSFRGMIIRITGENDRIPDPVNLTRPVQASSMLLLAPMDQELYRYPNRNKLTSTAATTAPVVVALRMYHVQMMWYRKLYATGQHSKILDHEQKPHNTQQYFLIYTASRCVSYRDRALVQLSHIAPVHYGGRCHGGSNPDHRPPPNQNITATPQKLPRDGFWDHNLQQYQQYQFCLVLENTRASGYMTEKILLAFTAGCIPIYYGTDEVTNIFNEDAFIWYDVHNPQPALNRIRYLRDNNTAYHDMLYRQPILAHGKETMEQYFSFSDDVGEGKFKKRIQSLIGSGFDRYQFVEWNEKYSTSTSTTTTTTTPTTTPAN